MIAREIVPEFRIGVEYDGLQSSRSESGPGLSRGLPTRIELDARTHACGIFRRKRASASRCSCDTRWGETLMRLPIACSDSSP